jgi:hypothetical protein
MRASHFKTEFINNLSLFHTHTKGSIQGEGSAFFMISGKPSPSTWCRFADMKMLYKPEQNELQAELDNFIATNGLHAEEIDLIVDGASGDVQHDAIMHSLIEPYRQIPQVRFKHLCGEHTTATSFALWLGASILKKQEVPDIIKVTPCKTPRELKNILVLNQYMGKSFTFILLKRI